MDAAICSLQRHQHLRCSRGWLGAQTWMRVHACDANQVCMCAYGASKSTLNPAYAGRRQAGVDVWVGRQLLTAAPVPPCNTCARTTHGQSFRPAAGATPSCPTLTCGSPAVPCRCTRVRGAYGITMWPKSSHTSPLPSCCSPAAAPLPLAMAATEATQPRHAAAACSAPTTAASTAAAARDGMMFGEPRSSSPAVKLCRSSADRLVHMALLEGGRAAAAAAAAAVSSAAAARRACRL